MTRKPQPRVDIAYQLERVATALREMDQKVASDPDYRPRSLDTLADWVDDIADQAVNPR